MNGFELIAALVGHVLSWPVMLLVVVLLYRKPLGDLVGRVRTLKVAGAEATWDRLEAAVGDAKAGAQPGPGDSTEQPSEPEQLPPGHNSDDDVGRAAEEEPSFLIISEWERLLRALDDLFGGYGLSNGKAGSQVSLRRSLHELSNRGAINDNFVKAVAELSRLRNEVAHGARKPTPGEAANYAGLARELAATARLGTPRSST